jgi:thiol-disulfide isomerase/thioredoxin
MERFCKIRAVYCLPAACLLVLLAIAPLGCEMSDAPSPGGQGSQMSAPASIKRLTSPPIAAQGELILGQIRFVAGYQRGCDLAIQQGKPMLVFFIGRWCRYCQQMAAETFADPQVSQMADRFVCVAVDADEEPDVCDRFRVRSYPTVQFLSRRGESLQRLVGMTAGAVLVRQMHAALDNLARAQTIQEIGDETVRK